MNFNQPQEELIDQYIRGELSGAERSTFETQIASNADLKQQVVFQQQVVHGLSEYRKAQLKARLDLIDVAPAPFMGLGQSQVMKIAGGVIVASLIGFGIYYTTNLPSSAEIENQIEIVQAPIFENREVPSVPEVALIVEESSEKPIVPTRKEEPKKTTAPKAAEVIAQPKLEETAFNPVVDAPNPQEVNDRSFKSENVSIPEVSGDDVVNKSTKPIHVETIEKAGSEKSYKYYEGKLYLFGEFKKDPYEILEINSRSDRAIYIYFEQQYYKIEPTIEVKALKPLTNETIINDLKIIRSNKSE